MDNSAEGGTNFGSANPGDATGSGVTANYGTIGGGLGNEAYIAATVPGGRHNAATGECSIAFGNMAKATRAGQMSFSSGSPIQPESFDNVGLFQSSKLILSGSGTDPGTSYTYELKYGPNNNLTFATTDSLKAYAMKFKVLAKDLSNNSIFCEFNHLVTTDISGVPTVSSAANVITPIVAGSNIFTVVAEAASSPNRVRVKVTSNVIGTSYAVCELSWLEILI